MIEEPSLASEVPVRTTANPTRAGDWALVLAAAGTEYRLAEREGAFVLLVAPADATAASAALDAYDAEGAPRPVPPAPDTGPSALGLLIGIALAGTFLFTGAVGPGSRWFRAGAADAAAIFRGEVWRAVTALTLHADLLHLVGNVIAAAIFGSAVGRWLGGGAGLFAIAACAVAANLLTAAAHRTDFVSIGASTATFAALGLMAGLQVVRRLRGETRRLYAWVPLGAGLGLYAMLGVGAGADTYAHLFGLGLGAAVGAGLALLNVRAPRAIAQALLALATVAGIALSWGLALRAR
ncbi:MAG TPA: rhomboid family intramembrane serine protease [Polyangia bacterium]|nr:rhomboid family intramembrane serine protease [Polyangia bacterium]